MDFHPPRMAFLYVSAQLAFNLHYPKMCMLLTPSNLLSFIVVSIIHMHCHGYPRTPGVYQFLEIAPN